MFYPLPTIALLAYGEARHLLDTGQVSDDTFAHSCEQSEYDEDSDSLHFWPDVLRSLLEVVEVAS